MAAPKDVAPRTRATAHLSVGGLGDDLAAASLRRSAEGLLACGLEQLTVDLSSLEDAHPAFLHALAALTATARVKRCEPHVIGVHSPALLEALHDAPLDELFAIYQATQDADRDTTVPPESGRSAEARWVPEAARVITPAPVQRPVASAEHAGGPAEATGAPGHARTEDRTHPPKDEGALVASIHTTETTRREWIDRLVDLHVLAAHGDTDAAVEVDQWMAADPEVRQVRNSIDRTCEVVHQTPA